MSTDAALPEKIPIAKSDVILSEATPAKRKLTWELNGASWAGPMTLDDYIGREQALSETPLSVNGGTKYFILHHKSDPNLIVSSCEVLTKQAYIARHPNDIQTVPAYGIASVFTPPQFRGQGLASHMMRLIQSAVDNAPISSEFGALYSDIGRSFYTRLGWPDFPSPQVTLGIEAGYDAVAEVEGEKAVLLTDEDIPALCERDSEELQQRLTKLCEDPKDQEKTYIAFRPDYTQMSWHFTRVSYVAKVMRSGREVKYRGARIADGSSWLYWDHDLRENKLKILRVVVGKKDGVPALKALLGAAVKGAQDWGLPKVLVWAPGVETSTAALELWREGGGKLAVVFDEREDGSIPSLRWKEGKDVSDVAWEANEYYAWC